MKRCPKCKQTEYVSLDRKGTKLGGVLGAIGGGLFGVSSASVGAEAGAIAGSFFGPVGMAIGAGTGGVIGFFTGITVGATTGAGAGSVIDESFQTYYCSYCDETFNA